MERSDFIGRGGERKIDFMQYYGLVERVYARDNNLTVAELRLLIYLDPIPYFTRQDFKDGTLYYTWDKDRFKKLLDNDWLKISKTSYRAAGDHFHYNVTIKGTMIIDDIYKIMCGEIELPDKFKRTRENAGYADKVLKNAITAMDKRKAKDRLENY